MLGNNVTLSGNLIAREFRAMTNKQIQSGKRGRPVGSGHGTQGVLIVRHSLEEALNILKRDKNVTLAELIANGLSESTASMNQTLQTLSRFMPKDVNIVGGGSFADALTAAADILRAENARPVIIENDSQSNNITEMGNNITRRKSGSEN